MKRVSIEFDSTGRVLAVSYDGSSLSSFDTGLTDGDRNGNTDTGLPPQAHE